MESVRGALLECPALGLHRHPCYPILLDSLIHYALIHYALIFSLLFPLSRLLHHLQLVLVVLPQLGLQIAGAQCA